MQRTGGLALWPILLNAVAFYFMQPVLYIHATPSRSKATGRAEIPLAPSQFC